MSKKKEMFEKEKTKKELAGVRFIYNVTTQAFVETIRAGYNIKLPFVYDFVGEKASKEAPEQLIDDIRKFVDDELEQTSAGEKLDLGRDDLYGQVKVLKRQARKWGFMLILLGLLPNKLMAALAAKTPDPVAEIREFREQSLLNYIMTGEVEQFTPEVFEYLFKINLRGEPFVLLIANELTSPDIAAAKFRKFFLKAFGKKKRSPNDPIRDSKWYEMQRAGIPIRDIADQWIEENDKNISEVGTSDYLKEKRKVNEYIASRIKEFKKTIK